MSRFRAMLIRWICGVVVLAALCSVPIIDARAQTILRVDGDAPPGGDGSSWAAAIDDLAIALADAAGIPGAVEIWVAANTYLPDSGTGDVTRSFDLPADVRLLGGFAGGESSAGERDPTTNETILSGDLLGDDLPDWLERADNTLQIVRARDLAVPSVIDGFTLIGGNADFPGQDLLGGGAIFVERSDLDVRRCLFTENTAGTTAPTLGNFGAAIFVKDSGVLTVDDCRFVHNRANAGGAIGGLDVGGSVDVLATDSIFEDNLVPTQSAGAIRFVGRTLVLERCEFTDNHAGYGGAIHTTLAEQVEMRNCTFERNMADVKTAAVWLERSDNADRTPAVLERCRFLDHWTDGGFPGGTLHLEETIVHMSHCEILGGFNVRVNPNTGAIEGSGTISVDFEDGHRFLNCLVADNFAGILGGVVLDRAQAEFFNCTFHNNRAAATDPFASGIAAFRSVFGIDNTILWGNRFGTGAGNNLPGTGGEIAQLTVESSTLSIDHSTVEGWSGALGGAGNQGDDPLFVNEGAQDLHLQAGSPAIDAGDNAAVPVELLVDLDGRPRIVDGDGNGSPVVDMGVYEFEGGVAGLTASGIDPAGPPRLHVSRTPGSRVRIGYHLPQAAEVDLGIYDVRGRLVRRLMNGQKAAGEHVARWETRNDASGRVGAGVYFVRLVVGDRVASERVVIVH